MQKITSTFKAQFAKAAGAFTMIPVMALSGVGATTQSISILSVPFTNSTTSNSVSTNTPIFDEIVKFKEQLENKEDRVKAAKIDKYFANNNLPLSGYGDIFVDVADKYDLDWRLLPAIAMRESTGGKFSCPGGSKNVFGWHSCKTYFKTYEEAIDKVGAHLAGEIKSTSGYYKNKTIPQKLKRYNSVIPDYTQDIYSIMSKIEGQKVEVELALN